MFRKVSRAEGQPIRSSSTQGLGRTETIRYDPWVVRVEAPGYRPFVAALAPDSSVPAGLLTDPPLGLAFPPPPSATIRLTPGPRPEETQEKTPASTGL